MSTRLGDIRACLEGVIPAIMATCHADGTPNVAYISQVFYVDEQHVALSFQFFNKTRQNILSNPYATVLLLDPQTALFYRLHLHYRRTETSGPLFEGMKAQLAGIASHTGMAGVFKLQGSDVYAVQQVEALPGEPMATPEPRRGLLGSLRRGSERLARCANFGELVNAAITTMTDTLQIEHAMVLMLDPATHRLYTVGSCGYSESGVGSEIEMGDGVIGVAARERIPVRIMHMTYAYLYTRSVRRSLRDDTPDVELATTIPYPGLSEPHSQLAVPIVSAGRLLGVLFAESPQELRFSHEDEDLLVAFAGHLGAAMDLVHAASEAPDSVLPGDEAPVAAVGQPLRVRRYPGTESVFINDSYLIKGVAGSICWKLLTDYVQLGRTEFSNRELRLDPSIRLPEITDNLEARLLLLQRRLAEHSPHIALEKTGRGRFRLVVTRPVELHTAAC